MSLLCLPDQALTSIFLSLDSSDFRGWEELRSRDARSLAACSTRLNSIYRDSVQTLSMWDSQSLSQCGHMVSRFLRVSTLRIFLSHDAGVLGGRTLGFWPESLKTYTDCLLTEKTKSIFLQFGKIHVGALENALNKCNKLETFAVSGEMYCERDTVESLDEECSFSLERHASSLKRLFVSRCMVDHEFWIYSSNLCCIDLRWFQFSSLSALTHLTLQCVNWDGNAFRKVAGVTSLEEIDLTGSEVSDADLEAVLPFLSKLRSVKLCDCRLLTHRSLAWLPQVLDHLSLSQKPFFESPVDRDGVRGDSTRTVKTLKVTFDSGGEVPRFEYFLEFFEGSSLESMDLRGGDFEKTSDLQYLLERTPNLKHLDLQRVGFWEHFDRAIPRGIITSTTGLEDQGDMIFS